jgi:hypothetical protein
MEENQRLSASMSPDMPEQQAEMKPCPYRELIGKLLYLAIAMQPDISYALSEFSVGLSRILAWNIGWLPNTSFGISRAPST